jgi:hypothetical protein
MPSVSGQNRRFDLTLGSRKDGWPGSAVRAGRPGDDLDCDMGYRATTAR